MAQQLGSNYYNSPYKFNGKELDEETGFYYYGARYYDPRISIWQSVDPLAEQAPNWTPYRYCFNNPINLIDPNGMFEHDYEKDDEGKVKLVKKTNDKNDRLIAKNGDIIHNNVQKGILYDNMDLGGEVNLISLSQKNENGEKVEMDEINDLLFKISLYDQKEISWGKFVSFDDIDGFAVINPYKNNKYNEATSNVGYSFHRYGNYYIEVEDYHTHPSFKGGKGNPSMHRGDYARILNRKGVRGFIISREASLTRYDDDKEIGIDMDHPLIQKRSSTIDQKYVNTKWGWKKKF